MKRREFIALIAARLIGICSRLRREGRGIAYGLS
jgi:hypothetical protein